MLIGRTRLPDKQVVATRTVTRTSSRILGNFCCALALARGFGVDWTFGIDWLIGIDWGGVLGMLTFALPDTIAAALRPSTGLTSRSRSILPRGTPSPPVVRRLLALRTTVPGSGTRGLKPLPTSL